MVTTNDEASEFPNRISTISTISTSTSSRKRCFSVEACRSLKFPEYMLLDELVYEIFVRLPVKSLIQFRCLSKGMRRMIDSPIFIKNHCILRSAISDESDREYAIFLHQPRFHRLFSLNFEHHNGNLNLNRGKSIELDSSFLKKSNMMMEEVLGWCCNGLFCLKNTSDDRSANEYCVFWNPSNGTYRKIKCNPFIVSMGYDCVNDDYKLIRLMCLEARKTTTVVVEVYSFRKDSWRKLQCDYPVGQQSGLTKEAVCLNGVMHWLWINDTTDSMFIAAFDLAKETFTKPLPLPSEAIQLDLFPSHFTDFRGRLCLTFDPPDNPPPAGHPSGRSHTMWVMEKYGVGNSWSKLYHLGSISHTFYFPNSRSTLLCTAPGSLSWWDPQDGSEETIEIIPELFNEEAMFPSLYNVEPYIYVRNLLRLD